MPRNVVLMSTFILLLLAAPICNLPAHAAPVKIGVITDLSSSMAFWGKQTVLGAEMARDEINAGSERVVIVLGDHQLHAKNALSEYQKLTDLNNVDGIYIEFSLPSAAVAPVSALRKKPTIYSAAASSPLAASPMMYKSFLDYEAGCKQIGEYWRSLGLQKVGILKPNAEFGELCLEGMRKVYPDLFEQDFNPGDEMATQVLALGGKFFVTIQPIN